MPLIDVVFTGCLVLLLIGVAVYDFLEWRIPDVLNLSLFVLGVLATQFIDHMTVSWALVSAAVMFFLALLVRAGFEFVRGYPGLGLGDVKFLAASATLVGLEAMPIVVFIASITALFAIIVSGIFGNPPKLKQRIFFGPFLSAALFAVWIWPYLSTPNSSVA